jgi:hypothetical protein
MNKKPGHLWLMPIILATWEAEMERTEVPGKPGQKQFARLHLSRKQLGVVGCTYHPSGGEKLKIGESRSRPAGAKSEILSQK